MIAGSRKQNQVFSKNQIPNIWLLLRVPLQRGPEPSPHCLAPLNSALAMHLFCLERTPSQAFTVEPTRHALTTHVVIHLPSYCVVCWRRTATNELICVQPRQRIESRMLRSLCGCYICDDLKHNFNQQHLADGATLPDSTTFVAPLFLKHFGRKCLWLREFYTSCLNRVAIPTIWRKETVIAIPKPNKPMDDPRSYRPIALLCIPYKLP